MSGKPSSILDQRGADFEYDGEMGAECGAEPPRHGGLPFCRLSGTANVLIMPAFHAASISTKMLQELGGGTVIGPMLVGLSKPVQIASLGASDSDLVNMAALSAFDVTGVSPAIRNGHAGINKLRRPFPGVSPSHILIYEWQVELGQRQYEGRPFVGTLSEAQHEGMLGWLDRPAW